MFLLLCASSPALTRWRRPSSGAWSSSSSRRAVAVPVEVFCAVEQTGVATVHLRTTSARRGRCVRAGVADRSRAWGGWRRAWRTRSITRRVRDAGLPLARDRIGRAARGGGWRSSTRRSQDAQIAEVMRDLAASCATVLAQWSNLGAWWRALSASPRTRRRRGPVERVCEAGVAAEVRPTGSPGAAELSERGAGDPGGDPHSTHRGADSRAGRPALIEVTDTGPGCRRPSRAHLRAVLQTRSAGDGLGLWLSRPLWRGGGTLTTRNRPEGGAVFTVSWLIASGGPQRFQRSERRARRLLGGFSSPRYHGHALRMFSCLA